MNACKALAFAILMVGTAAGPTLGQTSQSGGAVAGLANIRGAAQLEKASGDLKSAGTPLATLLPELVTANPNLYVYLIQQTLVDRGLRSDKPTGLLTADTITQINRLCAAGGIEEICAAGPLSPAAAAKIGMQLDGDMPAATAAAEPPKNKAPAQKATEKVSVSDLFGGPEADLDGDGIPDSLMRADDWLYLAKPEGKTVDIGSAAGARVIGFGDIDGDGVDDIVLQRDTSGWLFAISLKDGNLEIGDAGGNTPVAVGKFGNSDGADILLQRPSGWLYGLGTTGSVSLGDYNNLKLVSVEDHDGDGMDDLLFETASGWRGWRLSSSPTTLTPA